MIDEAARIEEILAGLRQEKGRVEPRTSGWKPTVAYIVVLYAGEMRGFRHARTYADARSLTREALRDPRYSHAWLMERTA